MSLVPKAAPYRSRERLASGADGSVLRVGDVNTDAPFLLVVTPAGDREAADRVAVRLAAVNPRHVVRADPGEDQLWASLQPDQERVAVGLVGLDEVPRKGWFAEAYGWPNLYPKTFSQLAFRIAVLIVGAWLVLSVVVVLR